jgi:peptidoglycan L-alanyl-D-glutamate endopeptidase CwlK
MVFLFVLVIFLIAGLLLAFLMFPDWVRQNCKSFVGLLRECCRKFLYFAKVPVFMGGVVWKKVCQQGKYARCFTVRHKLLFLSTALLLGLPPVLLLSLRGPVMLEGYVTTPRFDHDRTLVSALLRGEKLAPPRPLPPEFFSAVEVERIRPRISFADRSWDNLDSDFKQRLLIVYKIMRDRHGYDMALLEGFRSPERQSVLIQQPGTTNAGAWQSYHQYGLAADSAFIRNGKLVITEKDPWAMRGYELYGQVAEEVGLTWGGRWKLLDFGHVEYRKPGSGPHSRR